MPAGYIDGSNLHAGVDVIAVAGCVADTAAWEAWEQDWGRLLAHCGVARWDHAAFMAKQYPTEPGLKRWSEARWLEARKMLCDAFARARPYCAGATVRRAEYEALKLAYPSLPSDPYYFLLDRCMSDMIRIQSWSGSPEPEGFAVFCDQDRQEASVKQMADWHRDFVRSGGDDGTATPAERRRAILFSYGSNLEYVPLQAADVVAHEVMRAARQDPPPAGPAVPSGSFILDRLMRETTFSPIYYSKRLVEMELDGSGFVPGYRPEFRFAALPRGSP